MFRGALITIALLILQIACHSEILDFDCHTACNHLVFPTDEEGILNYRSVVHGECSSYAQRNAILFRSCRKGVEAVSYLSCTLGCDKQYNHKKIGNFPEIGTIREKCSEGTVQANDIKNACRYGVAAGNRYFATEGRNLPYQKESSVQTEPDTSQADDANKETSGISVTPTLSPTFSPTEAPTEETHSRLENIGKLGKTLKQKLDSILHKTPKTIEDKEVESKRDGAQEFQDDLYDDLE